MAQKRDHALFDLDGFLPYRLAVVSARVSRRFAARYKAEFGISIAQWRVLAHLAQAPSVSVRDIHARVDLDKPTVSRAAASLERAGYLEKSESDGDRRLVELRLTAEGRALIERIIPLARQFQAELQQSLGKDRAGFESGLDRLFAKSESDAPFID